jgi:hypothetical protein
LPRSPSSSLPSWSETWTKAEDWFLVLEGQEDLLQRGLGSGFCVQFSGALWEGICEVDEMASRDGASGDFRLGLMKRWLKEQAIIQELVRNGDLKCSVNLPEFIEFIDTLGNVDKMYRLPNGRGIPVTSPRKCSLAPPSPPKLNPLSSSKFPSRKDKGKGKAREIYISQSERNKLKQKLDQYKELHRNPNSLMENPVSTSEEDEFIKKLASEVTDQIRGVVSFTETPRLDYIINQALAGDTWYSKPDNDETVTTRMDSHIMQCGYVGLLRYTFTLPICFTSPFVPHCCTIPMLTLYPYPVRTYPLPSYLNGYTLDPTITVYILYL